MKIDFDGVQAFVAVADLGGFNKAAEQGLAGSQLALALMYEEGNGVPQDLEKAQRLYQLAGY